MTRSIWTTIVECDDDIVEGEMLDWAGVRELWDEIPWQKHPPFIDGIVAPCSCAFIETEQWDAGAPGRSGVNYTISTSDAEALRTEIRERIEALKDR